MKLRHVATANDYMKLAKDYLAHAVALIEAEDRDNVLANTNTQLKQTIGDLTVSSVIIDKFLKEQATSKIEA